MRKLRTKWSCALLVLWVAGHLVGCDNDESIWAWHNKVNSEQLKNHYNTIELEGCEYIMWDAGMGYSGNGFLAHKGNCKNPIHACN